MGVKSACACGQALAEDVLRAVYDGPGPHNGKIGLSAFCIVWMDDILIYDEDTPRDLLLFIFRSSKCVTSSLKTRTYSPCQWLRSYSTTRWGKT